MGNAGIVGQAADIQLPTDAPGAKLNEPLKQIQIPDGCELPQVPFNVGLIIVAQGLGRVELFVPQAGIKSVIEQPVDTR